MKTIDFINDRKETWLELEKTARKISGVRRPRLDDRQVVSLMHNYRRTMADLSLAQSHYPSDPLVSQLSSLVVRVLSIVAAHQEGDLNRIRRFFSYTLPATILKLSRLFLVSLAVFGGAALFGYFLTVLDPYAANAIAGDRYVFMTLENIEKGKPFAVYESGLKYAMSGFIMANNIKVAFTAFAFGAFYGLGTFFILLYNGLMLGSIAAVFGNHGLLFDFTTTVLIHGTLELFAIVVAGAAGLRLGQALFRPGDLRRGEAVYKFGVEAFQICAIMVPVFVIAGILEGYVTPLELSRAGRILIIAASAVFLVLYLGIPTFYHLKRRKEDARHEAFPSIRMSN